MSSHQPLQPDLFGTASAAAPRGIDLDPAKTIRLAVSGDVNLTRLELSLVDTPEFQRLRQVRQLGGAFWIYPTALHTRFDHSLGTLAMTERMLQAIAGNPRLSDAERAIAPEQHALARLYALLHDLTHVPFGHTLEDEFRLFARHDGNPGRIARLMGAESAIGRRIAAVMGQEFLARLLGLLPGGRAAGGAPPRPEDAFINDVVDNTICADLLDYLQRDAFFCNVAIETDFRFFRYLALSPHEGRRRLVVRLWKEGQAVPRRDLLNELIRLLDNRYLMSERVYYHHAKLVAGAMVAGSVARAQGAGELPEGEFDELGDELLLARLRASAEPAARRLAACLAARTLWKQVYVRHRGSLAAEQQGARVADVFADIMARWHQDAAARRAEEDRLAGLLGLEPGDLLLYCPDHRMAMKPAEILVTWNGSLRPLKDCTDDALLGAKLRSILDSHQNLWALRVFVNPARLADAATAPRIGEAMDALLTWDPARAHRLAGQFYAGVLERLMARETAAGVGPGAGDVSARRERALVKVLELPERERTVESLSQILHA